MKITRNIAQLISHLLIAGAFTLLTFFITDRFNTAMAFVDHPMTKVFLLVFAILMLVLAIIICTNAMLDRKYLAMLLPVLGSVLAIEMIFLFTWDRLYPQDILFTTNSVKYSVCALAVVAAANAVITVVMCRRAVWREYRRIKSGEVRDER